MKKPADFGRVSELLYSDVGDADRNIESPPFNYNIYEPPSIIPGISYPCSDREERIIDATWKHAKEFQRRGLL